MTNEEAQELIAEIEKKHKTECGGYPCVCVSETAKIITRFANKPPYTFMTSQAARVCEEEDYKVTLRRHVALNVNVLHIEDEHDAFEASKHVSIQLTNHKLKQLRDNCDKMLSYLEWD